MLCARKLLDEISKEKLKSSDKKRKCYVRENLDESSKEKLKESDKDQKVLNLREKP